MNTRRSTPQHSGRRRSRGGRLLGAPWQTWAIGIVVIVVAVTRVLWTTSRPGAETASVGGIPGPIGSPDSAQDVGTLVGKPAPAFTLEDSEGKTYPVTPGQGRPTVLIFHMGIT